MTVKIEIKTKYFPRGVDDRNESNTLTDLLKFFSPFPV